MLLGELNERLKEQQLFCQLSQKAEDWIIENAYDPIYGARPLRRFLQRHLETLIGREILKGSLIPGQTIIIDVIADKLVIQ